MKNIAKCKLCQSVIESFHLYDYVSCKCGEISISGGNYSLECSAKNFENFLRIDDQGNEIQVKFGKDDSIEKNKYEKGMSKQDMIEELDSMIKNIENLPKHVMQSPINHYDFCSFMMLISCILKK